MNKIEIILSLILLPFYLTSQVDKNDPVDFLLHNAISIDELTDLDENIYQEIAKYNVILIGEMHGTNEPTQFAFGVCDLIAKKKGRVILAMEIPKRLIGEFSSKFDAMELSQTDFFKMKNLDGRNGQAWFDLILKSRKNPEIEVLFIDNNNCVPRDSSMYLDILMAKKLNPNTKIVTLTGNIHNWLKPFRDGLKLGGFIMNDTINFESRKIMSINHLYKEGTMVNNMGNGLEIKTIEGKDNFFNTTIDSKMYLCPTIFQKQNHYSHFLYTEKVTHSSKVNISKNK